MVRTVGRAKLLLCVLIIAMLQEAIEIAGQHLSAESATQVELAIGCKGIGEIYWCVPNATISVTCQPVQPADRSCGQVSLKSSCSQSDAFATERDPRATLRYDLLYVNESNFSCCCGNGSAKTIYFRPFEEILNSTIEASVQGTRVSLYMRGLWQYTKTYGTKLIEKADLYYRDIGTESSELQSYDCLDWWTGGYPCHVMDIEPNSTVHYAYHAAVYFQGLPLRSKEYVFTYQANATDFELVDSNEDEKGKIGSINATLSTALTSTSTSTDSLSLSIGQVHAVEETQRLSVLIWTSVFLVIALLCLSIGLIFYCYRIHFLKRSFKRNRKPAFDATTAPTYYDPYTTTAMAPIYQYQATHDSPAGFIQNDEPFKY